MEMEWEEAKVSFTYGNNNEIVAKDVISFPYNSSEDGSLEKVILQAIQTMHKYEQRKNIPVNNASILADEKEIPILKNSSYEVDTKTGVPFNYTKNTYNYKIQFLSVDAPEFHVNNEEDEQVYVRPVTKPAKQNKITNYLKDKIKKFLKKATIYDSAIITFPIIDIEQKKDVHLNADIEGFVPGSYRARGVEDACRKAVPIITEHCKQIRRNYLTQASIISGNGKKHPIIKNGSWLINKQSGVYLK